MKEILEAEKVRQKLKKYKARWSNVSPAITRRIGEIFSKGICFSNSGKEDIYQSFFEKRYNTEYNEPAFIKAMDEASEKENIYRLELQVWLQKLSKEK